MIILMKGMNEEYNVKRCISDFHNDSFVDRIIVIDGGSTDYTVQELMQFGKVEVFVHPWKDSYHDMEICQSNIALSYVPHGELAFILDFDEKMSPLLKDTLSNIDAGTVNVPLGFTVDFSRRTYEVQRYPNSPHAVLDEKTGWPIISYQIGQYPDYQCRGFRKTHELRWVNSPHHVMIGDMGKITLDADIIHYEKDDYRDRLRIERKWARSQAIRAELGLPVDIFSTQPKPEVVDYYFPEAWKKEK